VETLNEPNHITGTLNLVEDSGMFSSYGPDFTQLSVDITLETSLRTHMKITPVGETRWEVPESILPRPGGLYNSSDISPPGSLMTTPLITSTNPFRTVIQRSNGGTRFSDFIFNFTSQMVFKDQYLQFVLQSPDGVSESFGFGESTRKTQRLVTNTTYSLWATDIAASTFDTSLYGVHPFIIQVGPPLVTHPFRHCISLSLSFLFRSKKMGGAKESSS
jgi:alpha-glucosidase